MKDLQSTTAHGFGAVTGCRHAIEIQVRSSPPEAVSIKTENFMLELYSTL
jgi:hypothetical protein